MLLSPSLVGAAPAKDPGHAKKADSPIVVGWNKQLLMDDYFIAQREGLRFAQNQPRKMGIVMVPDMPWESCGLGFCRSVIKEGNLFRMWYEAFSYSERTDYVGVL